MNITLLANKQNDLETSSIFRAWSLVYLVLGWHCDHKTVKPPRGLRELCLVVSMSARWMWRNMLQNLVGQRVCTRQVSRLVDKCWVGNVGVLSHTLMEYAIGWRYWEFPPTTYVIFGVGMVFSLKRKLSSIVYIYECRITKG